MRQVEKLEVSNIEKELLFQEWVKKNGVRMFLLDFDDTLCPTSDIFNDQIRACAEYLTKKTGLPKEKVEKSLRRHNDESFETNGVNPDKWRIVVDRTGEDLGCNKSARGGALEILNQIYKIPLHLFPEAENFLSFITKMMEVGIVTHANSRWTDYKIETTGLVKKFLPRENVYIVDQNGHKGAKEWSEAIRYFGYEPRLVSVAGDSPRSDIEPCDKIGVGQIFWVNGRPGWSIQQRELGDRIWRVNYVDEIANIGGVLLRQNRIVR